MFCTNCGTELGDSADFCTSCGVATGKTKPVAVDPNQESRWLTATLLCWFLGFIGVHNFYLGNTGAGVCQLILSIFSCGIIGGIWALIDLIRLFAGTFVDGNGCLVRRY